MGLTTLLRPNSPMGFFIPHRFAAQTQSRLARLTYDHVSNLLAENENAFLQLMKDAAAFQSAFEDIGSLPPPAPRWDQDWFSGVDAIAAYTLVRTRKPARIIEVGAGHSTRFLAKAIADAGCGTQLTVIDPEPRTRIEGLPVCHKKCLVTDLSADLWAEMEPNDFLSVDSSHILMPGTDVDFILNDVIPALPPGVIVHFHDIFLPDPYPPDWRWRGYNEQSAVATLLTSRSFVAIFASHFVSTRLRREFEEWRLYGFIGESGAPPSSLWLQKADL